VVYDGVKPGPFFANIMSDSSFPDPGTFSVITVAASGSGLCARAIRVLTNSGCVLSSKSKESYAYWLPNYVSVVSSLFFRLFIFIIV
jgi:hypothetical protein